MDLIPIQDEPEGLVMLGVNVSVHQAEKLSLEGIRRFVEASEEIRFEGAIAARFMAG
jgi:hypothetical protein